MALDKRCTHILPFLCVALLCLCLSCRRNNPLNHADLPPGKGHMARIFVDMSPRWSHNGQKIAFLRCWLDRRMQLFLASKDLLRMEPLNEPELVSPDRIYRTGRAGFTAPQSIHWSPQDRAIVYSRVEWFTFEDGERLPGTSLWTYDIPSGRSYPLATHPKEYENTFFYYRSPQWSPDGKRLAFIGEGWDGETALFVRTLTGSSPEMERGRYDQYADVDWPAWSPDGKRLAFRQGILRALTADPVETLRVIEPGKGEVRRVLTLSTTRSRSLFSLEARGNGNRSKGGRISPRIASLAWSPDGKRLVFTLTPAPLDPKQYSVWVLEYGKDASLRRVSPKEDECGYLAPIWINAHTIGALRIAKEGFIAVALSLKGLPPRALCHVPSDDLDWSPDRKYIVCATALPKGKPAASTTLRVIPTGM
jgi:dipeptidyl aminopeptidase/acylaminoacyl peptidase